MSECFDREDASEDHAGARPLQTRAVDLGGRGIDHGRLVVRELTRNVPEHERVGTLDGPAGTPRDVNDGDETLVASSHLHDERVRNRESAYDISNGVHRLFARAHVDPVDADQITDASQHVSIDTDVPRDEVERVQEVALIVMLVSSKRLVVARRVSEVAVEMRFERDRASLVTHDDGEVATDSTDVAAIANLLTLLVFEDVDLAQLVCGIPLFARVHAQIESVFVNFVCARARVDTARLDAFGVEVPVVTSDV